MPVVSKGQADEALIAAGGKIEKINIKKIRKQMNSLIEHQSNSIRPFIQNIDTINELNNKPVQLLVDKEHIYFATISSLFSYSANNLFFIAFNIRQRI